MSRLKTFIETTWLPFATTTHFVEAGVKEVKLCALPEREEKMRSMYATVRSYITNTANDNAKENQKLTYHQDREKTDRIKNENAKRMSILETM